MSDAHLGSGADTAARGRALIELLRGFQSRASHVYVLGDLFDFWFEYRHAIPKGHFQVLRALADLADAGVPITYIGGNHDFWCGSYLTREVGVRVYQKPLRCEHQGRRLFLAHGDGIGPGDAGYRFLKALLRHPLAITMYRLVHPDWGIPLAHRVSLISRRHNKERSYYLARMARHLAAPGYAAGDDGIVVGHIHDPLHLRDSRGRDFLVLGDWLEHFTYARLEEGRLTLERFRAGQPPEILPAQPWPPNLEPEISAAQPANSAHGASPRDP